MQDELLAAEQMPKSEVEPDRRRWERWEPSDDEDSVVLEGPEIHADGILSNLSEGGGCVVVFGRLGLPLGQRVAVRGRGFQASGRVCNVTSDGATEAYGLEWLSCEPTDHFRKTERSSHTPESGCR